MINIILAILLGFFLLKKSTVAVLVLIIFFLNDITGGSIFSMFNINIDQRFKMIVYAIVIAGIVLYTVILP